MISGRVVALKYCLLGCSWVLCSFEYCSIDLSRNDRPPRMLYWSTFGSETKNSCTCLPFSSRWFGGILQKRTEGGTSQDARERK